MYNPRRRLQTRTRLIVSVFASSVLIFSLFASVGAFAQNAVATKDEDFAKKLTLAPELKVNINSGQPPSIDNFNLTSGYTIQPVLWNLSLPSSVTFDDKGNIYVAEAGYAPGGFEAFPRILKIDINGTVATLVDRDLYPPITDIKYHEGKLYVANRGKITTVDPDNGKTTDIIMGLRNLGDYRTNQIAFGPDGRMYFGQGAATNSGVVGDDNYEWLSMMPTYYGVVPFHDVSGHNITLTGQNFNSSNMLTPVDPSDSAMTGAFVPFGNFTHKGQQVASDVHCTACIVSSKPDGTDLKVVAWGIRDPYGLAYDDSAGTFLTTTDGADDRGSRPIANDSDKVYSINAPSSSPATQSSNSSSTTTITNASKFYGWPDYFGNGEPVTEKKFQSKSENGTNAQPLQFLMQNHPPVEKPLALIGNGTKVTQIALSTNNDFGFKGKALIAEFGSGAGYSVFGSVGVPSPASATSSQGEKIPFPPLDKAKGQKIIIFDPKTRNYSNFLSLKNQDPSFRPAGIEFTKDGSSLYVASVGKAEIRSTTPRGYPLPSPMPWYYAHTGILWRITKVSSTTMEQGLAGEPKTKQPDIHLSPELQRAQINFGAPPTDPKDLRIDPGYTIQPILWNLDKPGSFAFDNKGNMYIASTGVTYGKQTTTPAIYKVDAKNGTVSIFADRPLHGILSDIEFNKNNGLLYVAHRNIISTVNVTSGVVHDLVNGLPTSAYVTHPMGQLAFAPNGRVFFNVGGLSNTAVPDISDYGIGWIAEMPFMHEVPAIDIHLNGVNFQSDNFLTAEPGDKAITGGFMPFGVPAHKGQLVKGDIKCTACIFSIKPDGTDLKVHAWGVRSAFGMAFDDKGRLYWSNNGNDDKGIRRVTADPDTVSVLDPNAKNLTFFGWPDFIGMGESITAKKFNESPAQHYPNVPLVSDLLPVTAPLVNLEDAVSATQLAFSTSDSFGYKGKMFLGEFGTSAPIQHLFQKPKETSPGDIMGRLTGMKVVMFDPNTGIVSNFVEPTVADGSFRPVGLQFSPDGSSLYIASIEVHQVRKVTPTGAILSEHAEYPFAMTGVVWKVTHVGSGGEGSSSGSNDAG
jgi:glucose/arabinose dehydrogenase